MSLVNVELFVSTVTLFSVILKYTDVPACPQVLHCTGRMLSYHTDEKVAASAGSFLTLLCEPIPHPSSVEFPLDCSTFLTRHTMDLRFTHCEGR